MKKILSIILVVVLSLSLLTACGESSDTKGEVDSITIGVSSEPHATLVELVVEELKEEGLEVKIVEFTDYVTPNTSLDDGDIDANFLDRKSVV